MLYFTTRWYVTNSAKMWNVEVYGLFWGLNCHQMMKYCPKTLMGVISYKEQSKFWTLTLTEENLEK